MTKDFEIIKEKMKNSLFNEKPIYNGFDKTEIVGYTVSAPSIVRKNYVLNRAQNLVQKFELNLNVFEDDSMRLTDRFIIAKKEYNVQQH